MKRQSDERVVGSAGGLPWAKVRRVAEHIDANLGRDLRLAELSRLVHMSPFHFARLFRRTTGVPPHRFVMLRRIDRAIGLLDEQGSSVAEIARLVGFRTPRHFRTVFRRLTGLTPSEYRARPRSAGPPEPPGGRDEVDL